MAGNVIDKQEDNEFTFQVSELELYTVEGIGSFGSTPNGEQMTQLMSDAIKR